MKKKAVLIQSMTEFLAQCSPTIISVFNSHQNGSVTLLDFFHWFLCRQIHTVYNLNVQNYIHRTGGNETIYYKIRAEIKNLDVLFTHHIKAPNLYSENLINVLINGDQLIIEYFVDENSIVKH